MVPAVVLVLPIKGPTDFVQRTDFVQKRDSVQKSKNVRNPSFARNPSFKRNPSLLSSKFTRSNDYEIYLKIDNLRNNQAMKKETDLQEIEN